MKRACLDCGRPTTGSRCPECLVAYKAPYHTAEYRREQADLVGQPCELRLPGCTGIATTADHVIPKAIGGGRGPLRPACAHCNYSRGARGLASESVQTCTGREKGGGVPSDRPRRRVDPSPLLFAAPPVGR